ncbi:MAG: sporulation protein YabP [Bacilli bacterium]
MNDNTVSFGTHEVKMVDRTNLSLSGVNKIVSFDDEEFLIETVMGNIQIKGEQLELLKLDSNDGNVKIRGKINSFMYLDGKIKAKEDSVLAKLFK